LGTRSLWRCNVLVAFIHFFGGPEPASFAAMNFKSSCVARAVFLLTVSASSKAVADARPMMQSGRSSSHEKPTSREQRSLPSACDPQNGSAWSVSVRWAGKAEERPLPLFAGDVAVASVDGCVRNGEKAQWRIEGGSAVGSGSSINVIGNTSSERLKITACIKGAAPQCSSSLIDLAAPRPSITIGSSAFFGISAGGKWARLRGHVNNVNTANEYAVVAYKHTDVFYQATPVLQIAEDRSFDVTVWLASNVDRVSLMLTQVEMQPAAEDGCNALSCRGAIDPQSLKRIPMLINHQTVHALATYYVSEVGSLDSDIAYLQSQFTGDVVAGAAQPAELIRSGRDVDVAYLYDQALAVSAFAFAGERQHARRILNALVNTQLPDGSWPFFSLFNGARESELSGRYAGAIAWVLLSINSYHAAFASREYRSTLEKGLAYLQGQMIPVGAARAVRFNPEDLPSTDWDETRVTAVEHNIEALAAFQGYANAFSKRAYAEQIQQIGGYLNDRWDNDHFRPGHYVGVGDNTSEIYLDTQALAVLAFGGQGRFTSGLRYNCANFGYKSGYISPDVLDLNGFSDFRWTSPLLGAPDRGLWSEGTLIMASALDTVKQRNVCGTKTATTLLSDLNPLLGASVQAGYPAGTIATDVEYGTGSATAPAAWHALVLRGKNPLRPRD
jgi:hypothetical protein